MLALFMLVPCGCGRYTHGGKRTKYYVSGKETCDSTKFDCVDLWNIK